MIIIFVSKLETDNIQTSNQKEIDLSHRSEISPMNELKDMTHRKQILKKKNRFIKRCFSYINPS